MFVQCIDDALGGCDTDCFLFHLVIGLNCCIFEDLLPDTLGQSLQELLHGILISWVIASFMHDALEFRDVLIYLWPHHF